MKSAEETGANLEAEYSAREYSQTSGRWETKGEAAREKLQRLTAWMPKR